MPNLSPEIAAILRQSDFSHNAVRIPPALDRVTYLQVNKVLSLFGAKWDRRSQSHVLQNPELATALQTTLSSGTLQRKKTIQQELGFFQTPEQVADLMCTALPSLLGLRILEPHAGLGRIAKAALRHCAGHVTCVEKYPPNAQALREEFDYTDGGVEVHEGDFLEMQPSDLGTFDAVLMNPPFQRKSDIQHVSHATQFVKPCGSLVAIMGAGVAANADKASVTFRAMVQSHGGTIEALPDNTFKESGTSVRTVLVHIPF